MKGKDEIKELFQKELGNYQAKVDPNLWNGIQAGLGSTTAATGLGSSIGLAGKIIIGASIAAAITVGTLLIVNNNSSTQDNNKSINEFTLSDSVVNDSNEIIGDKEKNINNIPSVDVNQEKGAIIDKSNFVEQQGSNQDSDIKVSEESNIFINDLKNSNVAFKENTNTKNYPDKVIIDQTKKDITPTIEVDKNSVTNNKKVDLSKVNIEIVKQNNQYVNFSAVEVPENAQITWNLGDGNYERSLNPEHFYAEAGIYNVVLTVQSGTEETTKNIRVEIQLKGEIGDLPNVFTPNGDGRNDEFFIECKFLKSFQLTVMDNNQNILYSTNDTNFRWNGLDKNGTPVKEGNYVYMIVAEDDAGNVINKYQRLNIQR